MLPLRATTGVKFRTRPTASDPVGRDGSNDAPPRLPAPPPLPVPRYPSARSQAICPLARVELLKVLLELVVAISSAARARPPARARAFAGDLPSSSNPSSLYPSSEDDIVDSLVFSLSPLKMKKRKKEKRAPPLSSSGAKKEPMSTIDYV